MLVTQNYYNDYAYLKKLGNSYKLIKCNRVKCKGLESVNIIENHDYMIRRNGFKFEKYEYVSYVADLTGESSKNIIFHEHSNDEKLKNNICRARNKILEYVLCNDFVYFVTLTLKPDKFDRKNLQEFIKKLGKFINNYNNRKSANIKYLLIPSSIASISDTGSVDARR